MKPKVVFTDFDGTYIKGDSYLRSLYYFPGTCRFIRNLPSMALSLVRYMTGNISRNDMKMISFRLAYKGMRTAEIKDMADNFFSGLRVFPKVREFTESLRAKGYRIVAVTASPDIYMDEAVEYFGFDGCICTQTEKKDGVLTGELEGMNCNYIEKVERIRGSHYLDGGPEIIVLGNSKGDEDMLKLADEFYTVDKKGNLNKGKFLW